MQKVWFTSDCHFGHKNVLKHCSGRADVGGFEPDDVKAHDEWLIKVWNDTVGRSDIVYILGDFAFTPREELVKHVLPRLHGNKILTLGNHDKSSEGLKNYFNQICQIKEIKFKPQNYPFIKEESFLVTCCHYPMVTWNMKHYGSVQLHGHCHGKLDDYNDESTDLRVDVGLDSRLGNYRFLSLEDIYMYFKNKTGGADFREYAMEMKGKKSGCF